jgi:hypothetical protein
MNGFLVFESPLRAAEFLQHPVVRDLGSGYASFRQASYQPVVTFRNVPDNLVDALQSVAGSYGGELQSSYRHDPISSYR